MTIRCSQVDSAVKNDRQFPKKKKLFFCLAVLLILKTELQSRHKIFKALMLVLGPKSIDDSKFI